MGPPAVVEISLKSNRPLFQPTPLAAALLFRLDAVPALDVQASMGVACSVRAHSAVCVCVCVCCALI